MSQIQRVALVFLSLFSLVWAVDVQDVVRKTDQLMRGETSSGDFEMQITTPRWTRTLRMKSWSLGTKKSFILINYPERDKGTTFLKINNEMWQYVPKIEKTIKIPPSMMLQSWMGSDFTNDDLVKESSIVDDYTARLLAQDATTYTIELLPKPNAAVTWGKIIMVVQQQTFVPLKEDFYDEEGLLIRTMTFTDIEKLPDRYFPKRWILESQTDDKKGNKTIIVISNMIFNEPLAEGLFSLQSLKSMSK